MIGASWQDKQNASMGGCSMGKRLRVLMVSEYFPPAVRGGGEISASLLARALAEQGVEVTVLTARIPGQKAYEKKEKAYLYRRMRTGKNPRSILSNIKRAFLFPSSLKKEVLRICKEQEFDVIHCMNMTSLNAVELKEKIKKPFIAHVNSYLFVCPKGDLWYHGKKVCTIRCNYGTFVACLKDSYEIGKMRVSPLLTLNPIFLSHVYARYRNFQRWVLQCDAAVGISAYVTKRLAQLGMEKDALFVLHNILEQRPLPKLKKGKKREVSIVYVGSLTSFKGPQILLEALSGLDGYACHIYGTGPMEASLRAQAAANPHVHFHAPVSAAQLPGVYARADVVVFPSLWPEPFGRVAIEAMAAGTPVIGSDIAGIKETIPKQTGILVPPGNVQELRRALRSMVKHPGLRKQMGRAGQRWVRKHFTKKKIAKEMMRIYVKVIARAKK